MVAAETISGAARFFAPVIYATGFVPVMIGTIVGISLIENSIGFGGITTFRYEGDIAAATLIIVIGGLVFGLLGQLLVWLERLRRPAFRDHLRHCTVLYVLMVTLSVFLIVAHKDLGLSLGYGLAGVGFLIAGYAVCIDALILFLRWRGSNRVGLGGVA